MFQDEYGQLVPEGASDKRKFASIEVLDVLVRLHYPSKQS